MASGFDLKAHFLYQNVTIGRDNWHIDEFKVISFDDSVFVLGRAHCHGLSSYFSSWCSSRSVDNLNSLECVFLQITKNFVHLMDQRGVTSQILDIFIGHNDPTNSFGQVDKQRRVTDIIFGNFCGIIRNCLEVLFSVGTKNR